MRYKIKTKKKLFLGGNAGGSDAGNILGSIGGIAGMIPGWGTAVQGALGMVGGAFDQMKLDEDNKKAANKQHINNWVNSNYGGWKGVPIGGGTLALGGDILKQFDAPTHENGGQMIDVNGNPSNENNAVAEIEKNETVDKGYAFSPNLIDKLTGKTFAEASKKIENKYKQRVGNNDDISRRTRDKELNKLKGANDVARQEVITERNNMIQSKLSEVLAPILAQQQEQSSQTEMAYGGYIPKLYGGGNPTTDPTKLFGNIIIPNNNINYTSFDDAYAGYNKNTLDLQKAIGEYQKASGDTYKYGGNDGILGDKTKGFFNDSNRVKGFNEYLNNKNTENQSLSLTNTSTSDFSSIINLDKNPVAPLGTPDTGTISSGDFVPTHEALTKEGTNVYNIGEVFANAMKGKNNNLVDKTGKIPVSVQEQIVKENEMRNEKGQALIDDAKKKGASKEKIDRLWKDIKSGKFDELIGIGAKGTEMIASGIAAFRPAEEIKPQYNLRASQAEETASRIGSALTKARQDNLRGLEGSLSVSNNALSNAVKMAMNQKAYNDYSARGIDIAAKEKGLENQVASSLASMISAHGESDKNARNLQEMLQSQTNAVSADAKKTFFESVGNMGEYFAKRGAANKKANEQMQLMSIKYPNIKIADRATYVDAIEKGDVTSIITFAKTNSISLDKVLEDAKDMNPSDKKKIKKELKEKKNK